MPHIRPSIRRTATVVGVAAAFFLGAGPAAAAAAIASRPLLTVSGAALRAPDPAVMHVQQGEDAGWYVYSTGGNAIRAAGAPTVTGGYGAQTAVLTPQAWFTSAAGSPDGSHELWAPSVFATGGHYVMYFTAWNPQRGARCVGIAQADSPLDTFVVSAGRAPICAPRSADLPAGNASAGDPSFYRSPSGQRYLLYQVGVANRYNVAIWAQRMQADGLDPTAAAPQVVLRARANGLADAIENPQLISHGGTLYLFVSVDFYRSCRYRTDVYSAATIGGFSNRQVPIRLLTQASTGLCGPGGASATVDGALLVFHAWQPDPSGVRVAYTTQLRWGVNGPSMRAGRAAHVG